MVGLISKQQTPQTLAQAPTPQADIERREEMGAAWKAYRGKLADPLRVESGQPNDNVKPNRCQPVVAIGASWLFGPTLKIACDQQEFVDGLWGDDDQKMTLFTKAAINGGVFGQVFLKLIPPKGSMKFPRIVNMNPQIVRIVTAPDDCDLICAFIIEYPGGKDIEKKQVIARVDPNNTLEVAGEDDLEDTWTITNYHRDTSNGQSGTNNPWIQDGASEDWLYPFPPIFTCQNLPNPNESWGEPDLTPDVIDMNRAINFNKSNTQRIVKFHGHPLTWAKNMRAEQISISVDGVICLPAPDSELAKLAAMENFRGLLEVEAGLRDDMDERTRIPATALGRLESLPKGNISGVALKLLFQPLMEKTTLKQRLYGSLIREVTRAALILVGKLDASDFEDYEVDLHWQNLLPIDDLSAAQTALILKQIGVSDDTIMQELGYNPDDEMDKSAKEDQKKLDMFSKGMGMPSAPRQMPGQPPQPAPSPFIGGQQGQ